MLAEFSALVRSGRIDPVDLVEESIRRIEAASNLNAVVALYADEAIEEAKSHSRHGALAGLPLLVKDMARVKGHVTTSGSLLYADGAADAADDTVVKQMRSEGAIVLGRTNSPEFGATAYTDNLLFGPTRNPWNTEKSPGGSSGGSAAALAAGLAPLATTSDGGGSVRGPAAAVGLVGYKPSMGAIGRNVLPRWIDFSTQGSTASTVADVVYQAAITHVPAHGDFLSLPSNAISLVPRMPKRILVCRTFRSDVDPDVEANFESTIDALVASGLHVERVEAPTDNDTIWNWFIMSTAQLTQSLRHEEHRWHELTEYVQGQLKFGATVTIDQYIGAQRKRHEVSARFDDLLSNDAVLLTPTANARSWPAEGPLPSFAGNTEDPMVTLNTPDANFTGHPATSAPMGLDDNGVPCGIHITGPRFLDDLTLGLAAHLERIQPWALVAPDYSPFALS